MPLTWKILENSVIISGSKARFVSIQYFVNTNLFPTFQTENSFPFSSQ